MNHRHLSSLLPSWFKQLIKVLLGANLASLIKALRRGPDLAWLASIRSYEACAPLDETPRNNLNMLSKIPEVSLSDLTGKSKISIQLDVQPYEDGILPTEHALALLSLAVKENPPAVLEIGTFCGHTTKLLAQNLKKSTIHTIDLPEDYLPSNDPVDTLGKDDFHLIMKRAVGREYRNQPGSERIIQHWGDTAQWDFSLAKEATFFFIDGSHTYDYVKNDSEKCFQLCRGQGTFLWHDCGPGHPGVLRFLTEWQEKIGRKIVRISGTTLAYLKTSP